MISIRQLAGALAALGAAGILAPAAARDTGNSVSFYFAAHEDDWQLFMNPSAFNDVLGGAKKTVFIHVTAGDAGLGDGTGGRKHPLFLARENGAESAVRFMADARHSPAEAAISHVSLNNHPLYRVEYQNTVSYFLRVADGNADGGGYPATHYQSLRRLAEGSNNDLAAVDGSTAYHGWRDLVGTIRAIVQHERDGAPLIQVNVAETDPALNPADHSDHLTTAKAALDAVTDEPCVRRVYYVDYASARRNENLAAVQRDMESSVFAVTLAGVSALDHPTSWRHYDESFIGRNYFRVIEPTASCGPSTAEVAKAERR